MTDHQRYYLHRRVRCFARLLAKHRSGIVYLTHDAELSEQQLDYLDRLRAVGYSVQLEIGVGG